MKRVLPFLLVVLLVALFAAGAVLRGQLDLDLSINSLDSVRTWVLELGWRGPAIFVGLVVFRSFLLLPSGVLLVLGGLAWGGLAGTLLGWVGIVLAALMGFGIARGLAGEWLRTRLAERFERRAPPANWPEDRFGQAGPWIIGLVTAYPGSPMSPFHWAAGMTTMSVGRFATAVALGGPLRAGAYAFLGEAILEWGIRAFVVGGAAIALVAALPLAVPAIRRRLFGGAG